MNATRSSRPLRTTLSVVLAVLASVAGLALTAGPASAEAYRYWGYYHLADGAWEFASTGNDGFTPEDGTVEGYRFAVSGPTDSRLPRVVPTFDDLCGDTPAEDGQKRVGVLVDFGRDADAVDGATPPEPTAACAVVDPAATGDTVLAEVAGLRIEGGLVCAVDGYPEAGCGDAVADADVTEEMAAVDEPITLPVPETSDAPASAEASGEAADPAELAADSVPTWVWALVAVAVLAALVGVIAMRNRTNRQDN